MVCNLLIVVTSLYRLLRTPPTLVEVGKSPIIPTLENSESGPSSNDSTSGTGGSERTTTSEGKASEIGGGEGSGNNDTGSYPKTATPSTSTVIELTELYESDLSFA